MTAMNSAMDVERDIDAVAKHIKHAGTPVWIVWGVLILATLLSWYLGDGHGATTFAAVAGIVTAFLKVALIGDHFMELRGAPPQLRWLFMAWCVVVPAVLCGIYLLRR